MYISCSIYFLDVDGDRDSEEMNLWIGNTPKS
jgi:hypothetical protein